MSAALWTTKRPEVKRTYQSKFKLNKGPSLAESLLNRAVWAFDALWSSTAATPAASSDPHGAVRKSLSTSPDLVDEDDFADLGILVTSLPSDLADVLRVS